MADGLQQPLTDGIAGLQRVQRLTRRQRPAGQAQLRPIEQRFLKRVAELKGAADARLDEFRWLLEELRVQLFAQELKTPIPVSSKRLAKLWQTLSR